MLELILSYLLDEQFLNRVILVLGVLGPLGGAGLGWIVGRIRKQVRSDLVDGVLIGSFLTVALIMWHVYNAIVDRLGLDTVNNLLANLVLFVAVGVGLGFVVRWVRPRLKGEESGLPTPAAAPPPAGSAE